MIHAAAVELLATKPFEDISVAEIASTANVSIGGFYRRFRDKNAVLVLVHREFIDECLAAFDERMSDEAVEDKTLEGITRTYIALMVRMFRRHRATILQVMKHSDAKDAEELNQRRAAFNEHVHGRFRTLLYRCQAEITHPEPDVALNMAIFVSSAAARDAVWRNSLRAYPVEVDDEALIDELTRGFVAYLRS